LIPPTNARTPANKDIGIITFRDTHMLARLAYVIGPHHM
jgi:hypothetical protein